MKQRGSILSVTTEQKNLNATNEPQAAGCLCNGFKQCMVMRIQHFTKHTKTKQTLNYNSNGTISMANISMWPDVLFHNIVPVAWQLRLCCREDRSSPPLSAHRSSWFPCVVVLAAPQAKEEKTAGWPLKCPGP